MGYKRGGERRGQYKRIAGMVFGVQPGHRPVQAEIVCEGSQKALLKGSLFCRPVSPEFRCR